MALLAVFSSQVRAERWSRQLTADAPVSDSDWVPIRNAKAIQFGGDLTPAAQNSFQFFAEPANNRFNLQQSHPAHHAHHVASPSEINSFSSPNTAPQFQFFNSQAPKQRTVQSFGGPLNKPEAQPLVQNQPPQFQYMQEIQRGPHVHHYQSQPIPKALQGFPQSQGVPQFQHHSGVPRFQNLSPAPQFQPTQPPPPFQPLQGQQPQSEDQVQLLYVPYDSLYQQQNQQAQRPSDTPSRYNILNQPVSASLINDFYSQNEVQELPTKPATTKKPVTTRRPTISPSTSSLSPSTPFDNVSKPKPHQPPLSMFVQVDKFKGKATEADVLNTLKNSNSIDVMDSFSKDSPRVFIGPSGMDPPAGYEKFDLPYLSSIEGTRYERKIEQLPFFVAPLSYKTPPGFSKIPLPAPHVGSVVVNQPQNSIGSNADTGFTRDNYYTKQPSTAQLIQSVPSTNEKHKKVSLTSGFSYGADGNVNLIRNEYTFPTLSTRGSSPAFDSRSVFTTPNPSPTFAYTASPSTAETPLTKVAYKHIEEQRNYGHSTHTPTTTRTPVTRTKVEQYATSPRSTARVPTTPAAFVELEEHKTVNEEYFGFEKQKKPSFSFSFGAETEKPAKDFNFRPIPEFDFGDTDYVTKKPKTKQPTKSSTQYTFPSSTVAPTFDFQPTVSAIENQNQFSHINGGNDGSYFEYRASPRPTTQDYTYNRFNFGNEPTQNTAYTPQQQYVQESVEQVNDDLTATTDNPNYSLPSELPSISPQLPGWINSLMDDKWMQKPNITEEEVEQTTVTVTTTSTTRRPINRGSRRPVTSASRATATDSTVERRPSTSRRRPTTYTSRNSAATTESSFPSRSTVARGSKIRYNITSEDRGKFRTRQRTPVKKEETNLDYQRDVLNQNYPSSVRPLDTTTEKPHVESEPQYQSQNSEHPINDYNAPIESVEVIPLGGNNDEQTEDYYTPSHRPAYYDNTIETSTLTTTSTTQETPLPSNHKQYSNSFVGLQEQMQVPQHKAANRLRGNFNYKHRNVDSFYNTNSKDSTTQKPETDDDEISFSVPTTQAPTTTEVPTTEAAPIPKRTNFPRRRVAYTTTEAPEGESTGVMHSENVRDIEKLTFNFFFRRDNAAVKKTSSSWRRFAGALV